MAQSNDSLDNINKIVKNLADTLENTRQQLIAGTPNRENVDFDLVAFWTNFIDATKLISHEATKFCMAFDGESMSSAEQCQNLVDKIEKTCLSLLAIFLTLPKTKGKVLYKEVHTYVIDILQSMAKLCSAILLAKSTHLQSVGDIWELCEAVQKLPKDNRDAVLALCQVQHDMVLDASQELLQTIESEGENQGFGLSLVTPLNGLQIPPVQTWTDSDRNVLLPCSGLVKASRACIKKTMEAITQRGDCSNEGAINELDEVAEIVKYSSSLADDFVLSLYPPMDHSLAREQALLVRNNAKTLLTFVKNSHFCSAIDETWIEFLEKAVDHNWVRINDMVLAD